MSKGRGLSGHSIYRLLWKIAKKTASRLQYFRQRLLGLQHRQSSCTEITTSAITSEQPPVHELENSNKPFICTNCQNCAIILQFHYNPLLMNARFCACFTGRPFILTRFNTNRCISVNQRNESSSFFSRS
ncbi:unnamed protein product [Calicophoron daubneyi]|uniref:Uncharacterized protein n=1 Tax=Calicophoron daubneyi TaxID=300641 RepID=A0AAV2T0D8_CALDB